MIQLVPKVTCDQCKRTTVTGRPGQNSYDLRDQLRSRGWECALTQPGGGTSAADLCPNCVSRKAVG